MYYENDSENEPYQATWHTKWKCIWCGETIPKGEKHWRYSGVWEGERKFWGMHSECYVNGYKKWANQYNEGGFYAHSMVRGEQLENIDQCEEE